MLLLHSQETNTSEDGRFRRCAAIGGFPTTVSAPSAWVSTSSGACALGSSQRKGAVSPPLSTLPLAELLPAVEVTVPIKGPATLVLDLDLGLADGVADGFGM